MNLFPRVITRTPEQLAESAHRRTSTLMLVALAATGKHLYQGTVDPAVVARRRAKNKAARVARRAARR